MHRVKHLPLHLDHLLAGVRFVPVPVEVLGHGAELDHEITGEILRLDLAALLSPQPEQGRLVLSHDDPGIRAADEGAAVHKIFSLFDEFGHYVFSRLA